MGINELGPQGKVWQAVKWGQKKKGGSKGREEARGGNLWSEVSEGDLGGAGGYGGGISPTGHGPRGLVGGSVVIVGPAMLVLKRLPPRRKGFLCIKKKKMNRKGQMTFSFFSTFFSFFPISS